MAGSPKRQRFSKSPRSSFYRLLYLCLVAAAVYAVKRSLQRRPHADADRSEGEGDGGRQGGEQDGGVALTVREVVKSAAEGALSPEMKPKVEKWVEKPTSLCFGGGGGNITILTVAVDLPQEYMVQMRLNRITYALNHGYRYCEVSQNLDFARPIAWSKVKAMLLVLSFSDTVVQMDADALFMNKTIKFEDLLDWPKYNTSSKDVIYPTDFQLAREAEPDDKALVNTGVYIMRGTHWSKKFLESQYRFYKSAIHNKFCDQDAVALYRMKNPDEFREHVAIIPYRYMNVPRSQKFDYFRPGDFVVHYAGGHSLQKYEKLLETFAQRSV